MNVVLLGATRGMGRALARQMAARGDRLFLLGRDTADLARSAADLDVRDGTGPARLAAPSAASIPPAASTSSAPSTPSAPATAIATRAAQAGIGSGTGNAAMVPAGVAGVATGATGFAVCDLEQPATFAPALDAAARALGTIDCIIVTAGLFATQDRLEADRELTRRLLTVDFAHTVLFCEEARTRLLPRGGTLCVFSSVAGDRGRKPVILYGAAKAGLSAYLEGLDHKFRAQGLRTVCVKPGFVRTSMTDGLPAPPFAGEPEPVAARVLRAIDRGTPIVYAPAPWALVMAVIRRLPRAVMRRVGF